MIIFRLAQLYSTTCRMEKLRPLVISGPSGSGKSTLLKLLLEEFPTSLGYSVSHTTRPPRKGEIDGVHYHFTTVEKMKQDIDNGKFIESAIFGGNMYGTSITAVQNVKHDGKLCVLDIDVQGVQSVKQSDLNPWYVFIKPVNVYALAERLSLRNTETQESIAVRLKAAKKEIEYGETPGNFDFVVINDDLDTAYKQLRQFVRLNVLRLPPNTFECE